MKAETRHITSVETSEPHQQWRSSRIFSRCIFRISIETPARRFSSIRPRNPRVSIPSSQRSISSESCLECHRLTTHSALKRWGREEYQRHTRIFCKQCQQAPHAFVRSEVSTEVAMKSAVFLDLKIQFVLHRRHITSPLQCPAGQCHVRFEVSTVASLKIAVSWDVATCGSCTNQSFGGT
jgi:hypothetical protein